jgi:protein SCO1/2
LKLVNLNRINFFIALIAISLIFAQCKSQIKQVRYLPILGLSTVDPDTKDTIYHAIDTFKVMDQMGQIVTRDSFSNKIYVGNFFFVTCPGICRQMNNELESVQKAFAGNNKVKFLSFTVNPDQDTIPALLEYAKLHDAVPYQWYFLRGNKSQILKLATRSFLAESNGYLVHSQNLTLVDSKGHIRGMYSGTVESEVTKLIADIKLLLKEENENKKT